MIQRFKLKKTLVLDLATWRCGDDCRSRLVRLGRGNTALFNKQGCRCCLGQFSAQAGVSDEAMLGRASPAELHRRVNIFVVGLIRTINESVVDTAFSDEAMNINDDTNITVEEKIKQLRALCEKHGRKLIVRNQQVLTKLRRKRGVKKSAA